MQRMKILPLFIVILFLASCKEKPLSVPVEFKSTTYTTLGPYDSDGKPEYLLSPRDAISSTMFSYITNTLPEQTDLRETHPELLSNPEIGDITITQSSDVVITFVSQNTTLTNAFGFYTYPTNAPPATAEDIAEIIYIFPSCGHGTKLKSGDRVKIGRFNPGTSIGFVIMQSAWKPSTKTLDSTVVHFCSNDVLNPEVDPALKKHAILMKYPEENKILIGFEDVDRTKKRCDHDFNDIVFYATVTP
jgi:hypothetical protein